MPLHTFQPEAPPASEMNVLPLIDVLLVLVIIGMLSMSILHWIPAQLPAPAPAAWNPRAPGQIVLRIGPNGEMSLNGQPIPSTHLVAELRAAYLGRPTSVLFISAHPELRYDVVVHTMDLARGAGIQTLALMPREDGHSAGR